MKTPIESPTNSLIKRLAALGSRKGRQRNGLYRLEGAVQVRTVLDQGGTPDIVVCHPDFGNQTGERDLLGRLEGMGVEVREVAEFLWSKVTTGTNPPGIACAFKIPDIRPETIFGTSPPSGGRRAVVVLDRIQDPGNLGTIIRTAAAFGFLGAIEVKGTVDRYSPKVVQASAASLPWVPGLSVGDLAEAVDLCRSHGFTIVATDTSGKYPPEEPPKETPIAILVGNEAAGLGKKGLEFADQVVRIPVRSEVDSLNVAVAFGIVGFLMGIHPGG